MHDNDSKRLLDQDASGSVALVGDVRVISLMHTKTSLGPEADCQLLERRAAKAVEVPARFRFRWLR